MEPNWLRLLLLLIPIFLIQLTIIVIALVDLSKRQHVRGARGLWLALLIVGVFAVPTGLIIAALYLAWGRNAESEALDDTD